MTDDMLIINLRDVKASARTINALLQLVNSHLVLSMHLVKQALIVSVHVELLLIAATHGWPQFTGQGVFALLQLTQ